MNLNHKNSKNKQINDNTTTESKMAKIMKTCPDESTIVSTFPFKIEFVIPGLELPNSLGYFLYIIPKNWGHFSNGLWLEVCNFIAISN